MTAPAAVDSAAAFLDQLGDDSATLGRRRSTVEAAIQWLLDHLPPEPVGIVETGTYCGAHSLYHSTTIFGALCRELGGKLQTVDLDAERVQTAIRLHVGFEDWIEFVTSDSVAFLRDLEGPVHLLHLDSWDYFGSRWNRFRSRRHCRREIRAAYPRLAPGAVVLIDDQNMDRAWWESADYRPGEKGKGATAVPWLLSQGWRVLSEDYQIALVREG